MTTGTTNQSVGTELAETTVVLARILYYLGISETSPHQEKAEHTLTYQENQLVTLRTGILDLANGNFYNMTSSNVFANGNLGMLTDVG